jgi:hypothetical protein
MYAVNLIKSLTMINIRYFLMIFLILLSVSWLGAQTPLWEGKGRIAISSDGNEHDHDDWAATPLSLALLAAAGLQDHLAVYTYSDHIWGSNQAHPTSASGLNAYQQMRESALGGQQWFGFEHTNFVCAVDNAEVAYRALRDEINKSSAENPLFIIAAGPMQVIGEAINRSQPEKRQYVTLVSHGVWNNVHADNPGNDWWDVHSGWTFKEIKSVFGDEDGGGLKCIMILDQNGGDDYEGLKTDRAKFNWIKDSPARYHKLYKEGAWDWLYTRLETCIKNQGKNFDPSDAGMIIYLLTGVEKTNPDMAREIMENPTPKK